MDELQAEVKTGKMKGVGYGVRRKWSRPQDEHKGERKAMLHVFGEIVKENRLVKVMSKPLEASLHGAASWQTGWKERKLLLQMAYIEKYDVIGSKMESYSTKARFLSEVCIECCSRLPPNP